MVNLRQKSYKRKEQYVFSSTQWVIFWYKHCTRPPCVHLLNLNPNGKEQTKLWLMFIDRQKGEASLAVMEVCGGSQRMNLESFWTRSSYHVMSSRILPARAKAHEASKSFVCSQNWKPGLVPGNTERVAHDEVVSWWGPGHRQHSRAQSWLHVYTLSLTKWESSSGF